MEPPSTGPGPEPCCVQLAESPVLFSFPAALDDSLCDELLQLGQERVLAQPSNSSLRSSSLYLREPEDFKNPVIRRVASQAARCAGLPLACAEPISITRYQSGQLYDWHYDDVYLPRRATYLAYLTSVSSGGETAFPLAQRCRRAGEGAGGGHDENAVCPADLPPASTLHLGVGHGVGDHSQLLSGLLAVRPTRGHAILFHNRDEHGERDERSLHGSLPLAGSGSDACEKWVVQVWLHSQPAPGWTGDWHLGDALLPPLLCAPDVAPPGKAMALPLLGASALRTGGADGLAGDDAAAALGAACRALQWRASHDPQGAAVVLQHVLHWLDPAGGAQQRATADGS